MASTNFAAQYLLKDARRAAHRQSIRFAYGKSHMQILDKRFLARHFQDRGSGIAFLK
jgi:hypothetical protein